MKTKDLTIEFWATLIIANIYFSGESFANFLIGCVWFIFALAIYFSNLNSKNRKK